MSIDAKPQFSSVSEENKALLAELKETKASTTVATVSNVAAKVQQTATATKIEKTLAIKTRDPKKFIKHKSAKAIANDVQVSIQERRSYRLDNITDNLSADVLYTTYAFYHQPEKRVFLSVEKMQELRDAYVAKLAAQHKFFVSDVYKFYDITGSNRSDTPRNSLMQIATQISKKQYNDATAFAAAITHAKEVKAQLIVCNISENPKRKLYEFVKV